MNDRIPYHIPVSSDLRHPCLKTFPGNHTKGSLYAMLIVFNQMVSLFLLMLTGYLANRSGVIDKTFESKVSRFIVNISLPATILNAVTGSGFSEIHRVQRQKASLPRNPLRIPRHRHLSSRYPPPAARGQPVFYHWCHNNTACDDRHRFHSGRSEVFHGVY